MTTARFVTVMGLGITAVAATAPTQAQTRAEEQACAALARWSEGPDDLTITEARFYANRSVAARPGAEMTLPPHCHVAGSFERFKPLLREAPVGVRELAVSSDELADRVPDAPPHAWLKSFAIKDLDC